MTQQVQAPAPSTNGNAPVYKPRNHDMLIAIEDGAIIGIVDNPIKEGVSKAGKPYTIAPTKQVKVSKWGGEEYTLKFSALDPSVSAVDQLAYQRGNLRFRCTVKYSEFDQDLVWEAQDFQFSPRK
jgi:hypothetical protein